MSDRDSDRDQAPSDFFRRWSQRKRDATLSMQDEAAASSLVPEPAIGTPSSRTVEPSLQSSEPEIGSPARHAETALAPESNLPDPSNLDASSDYSAFMSPKVERGLRQRALRKLFALPQFAVRDGLDDYDGDYTQFESLGDTLTHEVRRAAQRLSAHVDECGPSSEDIAETGQGEGARAPTVLLADDAEQTGRSLADSEEQHGRAYLSRSWIGRS